jgi:hypothetical protein
VTLGERILPIKIRKLALEVHCPASFKNMNSNFKKEHLSQAAVWKLTGHLIGAHSLSSIDQESPNSLVDLAKVPSGVLWSSYDFRL